MKWTVYLEQFKVERRTYCSVIVTRELEFPPKVPGALVKPIFFFLEQFKVERRTYCSVMVTRELEFPPKVPGLWRQFPVQCVHQARGYSTHHPSWHPSIHPSTHPSTRASCHYLLTGLCYTVTQKTSILAKLHVAGLPTLRMQLPLFFFSFFFPSSCHAVFKSLRIERFEASLSFLSNSVKGLGRSMKK